MRSKMSFRSCGSAGRIGLFPPMASIKSFGGNGPSGPMIGGGGTSAVSGKIPAPGGGIKPASAAANHHGNGNPG